MSEQPTKAKLWGGRFTGKTDPLWVNAVQIGGVTFSFRLQDARIQSIVEI